jgi:protein-tyrosine phosphatase
VHTEVEGNGNIGQTRPPNFLTLSDQGKKSKSLLRNHLVAYHLATEIEAKFHELVWLERNRLAQGMNPHNPDFPFARVPSAPHIKALDRYVNIQPWENNRVRLQVPEGKVDYINASPITLPPPIASPDPPDRYIAMQGPKKSTTDHVWRMIVEKLESPAVIVMLTETHEAQAEKCYPYFPRVVGESPLEINEKDEFGDGFRATVTCEAVEDTPAGDAIELRRLLVRVHKRKAPRKSPKLNGNGSKTNKDADTTRSSQDDEDVDMKAQATTSDAEDAMVTSPTAAKSPTPEIERQMIVYHFLYKKWPDFGVPQLADIDSFFTLMRMSRARNADPANPRVVHCSAGVGRSGTFIALEHLMRALDAGCLARGRLGGEEGGAEEDPVFTTVNALREQRRTMVQADAQYHFIYEVLRKLWVDKYGPVGEKDEGNGERAAKRVEVDPFVEDDAN